MGIKLLYLFSLLLLCSCANSRKEIVAEVDGIEIAQEELSQSTKQEIYDLLNLAYDIKMRALDDLIKQKLLTVEAGKQQMTLNQYLNEYAASKGAVAKDSLSAGLRSVLTKDELRNKAIQQLADSLYRKAKIKKYVYPPKQPDCAIQDLCVHYRGNLDAAVSFIVVSDFTCEKCVEFEKTLQLIFNKYRQQVKFGFINFSGSPNPASLACEAAAKQHKFWEFHDAIFQHKGLADSTFLFNLAATEDLDINRFKSDLVSKEMYDMQIRTLDELAKRGLFATPTIIINDRLVYMTNSYEELTKLLDYELQNQ